MAVRLKSEVVSAFKMSGLTLRSDASRYLVEVLALVSDSQREECIERLLEAIQRQPLKTSMIDRELCEKAVEECNQEQEDDSDQILNIIDAFSVPRLTYRPDRKKFIEDATLGLPAPCLHADAQAKAELFCERYKILHQRTARHELFTPPILGQPLKGTSKYQLRPVEFLLGSTARLGEIIVLGMLTQMKEGKWYLEDPTGAVQLDLSRANFRQGLITENCFVLAEGSYEDEVFHVNAFGFPPVEAARKTRAYFGNVNFFGGASATSVKASARLKQLEEDNSDAMIVFLSDVWLDKVKVMEKLRVLFSGYADDPPTCFVFCGNFSSLPTGAKQTRQFKENLRTLADLLNEFPSLVKGSRFVFVPGPRDPGHANILPRPPIPASLVQDFCARIPTAVFTSNPTRVTYCTQQMVVFREDIVMKMCRNCVRFPEDGDIPNHFARTLLAQGHLCALPPHVTPVYWAHDAALRLYPLPDVVVCADKYDPFSVGHADTHVLNPGSFPKSDFAFKVYLPATRQVEDSRIDD